MYISIRKGEQMRKKLYSERLDLCLAPEQRDMIKHIASCRKVTVNQAVRDIIAEKYYAIRPEAVHT